MNRAKRIQLVKHIAYALLLLVLYILQMTPGLFVLLGAKPIWLVPAAIAIAMMEGEFVGGIYGAAAGLLCDMGSSTVLYGFNGFFICLCCILAGLLVIYLMHCNVWGCFLFVFITLLICRSVEYFFAFGMWGYDYAWMIYANNILPTILYSTLVSPLPYLAVRTIHRRVEAALED